jgi:hypothetical protein
MTTNKPGSVNQQPLYGCTSCFEDYSWPAGDLRVFGSECWCDLCWDERRWEFPDQPGWNDLESFTPAPDISALVDALQAENERLRKDAERYRWLREHGQLYRTRQLIGIT